jgi:hypothetical protein
MSRLVSLLTKSTKSNVTKLFSNSKILLTNSTSVRMASSKSDVTNHSANESDKPQWERSDRYVSLSCFAILIQLVFLNF